MLTSEVLWTKDELLQALDDVSLNNLQAFIKDLLSKMFIEGLIYGNISRKQALEIIDMVENILRDKCGTKPLLPSQHRKLREVQLPDEGEQSVHPDEEDDALIAGLLVVVIDVVVVIVVAVAAVVTADMKKADVIIADTVIT
ncbi:insulin degrading enzyme [Plakobranchus ocellatus]|uniref:Insulin degrading enzyme n=1 Tax=Plakobranchus ocellatus TaxID=259542 RepID=A0AAV3ZKA5_9GAST|nr:insulin degrading enzyme [Plakobranchus ocellatus]